MTAESTFVSAGAATAVRTAGAALKSAARPSGLPASAKGRFVSTSRLAVSADVSMLGVTWPTTANPAASSKFTSPSRTRV